MPVDALLLALAAAFLHALWNLLVARAGDSQAATAVALPIQVIAFAPLAVLGWDLSREAVPYVLASAALHLAYFALLAAAYHRSELGLVYPLSRGLAPLLILGVSLAVLGADLSVGQASGVAVVAAGIFLVAGRRHVDVRGLGFSLALGACIAAYTLVDKEGMRHAAPIPYLELVTLTSAPFYVAAIAATRGTAALTGELRASTALAGVAMFAAYALVLAALALAPAAPVAAVRETSVVIATALAAVALRERVGPFRLAGAGVVSAGILTLAAG